LYTSNASANTGIRRSVNPTATSDVLRGFESVLRDFSGPLAGGLARTLDLAVGSNKLFAITSGITPASTSYGTTRVAAFDDTLAVPETLAAPRDTTVTQGTSVNLSWSKIDAPVTLTYQVQTSTDSSFANLKDSTTSIGTSITFTGFVPGTTYWWRVRVYPGAPIPGAGEVDLDLASKWSVGWTFMPELGMLSESGQVSGPNLQSPVYGNDTVIRRPTFSWLAVPGSDSYELQLATNPFFAMPTIKAPLSHTTWTWDEDLTYGTTYYWRVRSVKAGNIFSPWSESLFTVMTQPAPEKPAVVVTQQAPQPAPVINLPTPVVNIPAAAPPAPSPITPVVIWVIIIIGAILVIAVIVLIVRTRRVP
jgi:hypothetical protein